MVFMFCYCQSAEEVPDDVDMEGNKESDDSDEEYDLTEKDKETNNNTDLGEDAIHQLSKSEEKELRKFRKVDYSWLTAL
jgi:NET1-associated nuclear protein 1 (U3 small nucleolar RNA-associated protein 17)